MGRRILHIVMVLVAAASLASCSRTRIISKPDMVDLYVDLYLADQWLVMNHDEYMKTDSLLVYEPIFKKYGYTTEDFRESIYHYLGDPKRFARLLQKTSKKLESINQRLDAYRMSLIDQAARKFEHGINLYYDSLFFANTGAGVYEVKIVKEPYKPYLPEMKWLEPALDTVAAVPDEEPAPAGDVIGEPEVQPEALPAVELKPKKKPMPFEEKQAIQF